MACRWYMVWKQVLDAIRANVLYFKDSFIPTVEWPKKNCTVPHSIIGATVPMPPLIKKYAIMTNDNMEEEYVCFTYFDEMCKHAMVIFPNPDNEHTKVMMAPVARHAKCCLACSIPFSKAYDNECEKLYKNRVIDARIRLSSIKFHTYEQKGDMEVICHLKWDFNKNAYAVVIQSIQCN